MILLKILEKFLKNNYEGGPSWYILWCTAWSLTKTGSNANIYKDVDEISRICVMSDGSWIVTQLDTSPTDTYGCNPNRQWANSSSDRNPTMQ